MTKEPCKHENHIYYDDDGIFYCFGCHEYLEAEEIYPFLKKGTNNE